ncbi:restriction endonuclease subunit S [Aliarcobacter cryaerophilus]|uniref:restriction endonuclease subunit S n=1 Tax=Aliarcobacter cryaerophilus TaxID=28198 RepID=UPI0021B54EC4|nr:restriction endonuclease subunit S [Aliarcobacter cryaerophilus]MCT7482406.1 restriction endonuclease subunit S [Aliarcobacter cryaerophilus]
MKIEEIINIDNTIPVGWEVVLLDDLVLKIFAGGDKPDEVSNEKTEEFSYPIFSNGLKDKGLYGYSNAYRVDEECITISARGTIGYTEVRTPKFTPIVRLIVIVPTEYTLSKYLKFYFENLIVEKSGTSIPQLTVPMIKPIPIKLPPLNEQKRIVAKIEKLFSNLDNSDKYLLHLEKQLKRYRQSVLKSAFEGELTKEWRKKQSNLETADELLEKIKIERTLYIENEIREKFKDKTEKWIKDKVKNEVDKFYSTLKPIEDDKPFTIPTQWEWHLIQESTIKIHYGYTATSDKNIDGIGYLRITDIQNNKVNWDEVPNCIISEEEVKKYELEDDNIVFARTGATVGKSFLIKDIPIRSVFASYLIRLIPSNQIYSNYIYKFFQSPIYWNQIRENESGIGQPNVNAEKLSNLIFPLCSLEEQIEVVAEIEKHFSIIDKLEVVVQQSIKESKRLRQSILKQAFEGKLVEQDPNDESASILLEKIAKAKEEYLKEQKKQVRKK